MKVTRASQKDNTDSCALYPTAVKIEVFTYQVAQGFIAELIRLISLSTDNLSETYYNRFLSPCSASMLSLSSTRSASHKRTRHAYRSIPKHIELFNSVRNRFKFSVK